MLFMLKPRAGRKSATNRTPLWLEHLEGRTMLSPGPSVMGQWGPVTDMPVVAVNLILMRNGKMLLFQDSSAYVFDPGTGAFTNVPNNFHNFHNMFCAGAVQLSDGRILVAGGNGTTTVGTPETSVFDPAANTWTALQPMNYPRWYPTVTTLPDGRILATGGANETTDDYVPYPEIYDPNANTWTVLSGAYQSIPSYPHMFVLPSGLVVNTGASELTVPARALNVGTPTWTMVDPNVVDGASSVMYRPGQILKEGTASDDGIDGPAAATTYVLDMSQADPHWVQTASMSYPRATNTNLIILPNGNVMVFGGGTNTNGQDTATAVLAAEEWDPAPQTWSVRASMSVPRQYHSTAVLLPDGRVMMAGSGAAEGVPDQLTYQIYSPNYLFLGARPTISSVPSGDVAYGGPFFVGTADTDIASVVLIRPGAATHGFDMDQRYVPLSFTSATEGLNVTAPADSNLAPPGSYMLFIVNSQGVPSVAGWVHLASSAGSRTVAEGGANVRPARGEGVRINNRSAQGLLTYSAHRALHHTGGALPQAGLGRDVLPAVYGGQVVLEGTGHSFAGHLIANDIGTYAPGFASFGMAGSVHEGGLMPQVDWHKPG